MIDLSLDPFPDMTADEKFLAYAALCGVLGASVSAEVYADAVIVARKAVADRESAVVITFPKVGPSDGAA